MTGTMARFSEALRHRCRRHQCHTFRIRMARVSLPFAFGFRACVHREAGSKRRYITACPYAWLCRMRQGRLRHSTFAPES